MKLDKSTNYRIKNITPKNAQKVLDKVYAQGYTWADKKRYSYEQFSHGNKTLLLRNGLYIIPNDERPGEKQLGIAYITEDVTHQFTTITEKTFLGQSKNRKVLQLKIKKRIRELNKKHGEAGKYYGIYLSKFPVATTGKFKYRRHAVSRDDVLGDFNMYSVHIADAIIKEFGDDYAYALWGITPEDVKRAT